MRVITLVRTLFVVALVVFPLAAFAQDATISGSITDSTGGTLPGVTVTAANEATGNTFTAVTDERGAFRLPVRVGTYRISAELAGFNTINRTGLEATRLLALLARAGVGPRLRGPPARRRHARRAPGAAGDPGPRLLLAELRPRQPRHPHPAAGPGGAGRERHHQSAAR